MTEGKEPEQPVNPVALLATQFVSIGNAINARLNELTPVIARTLEGIGTVMTGFAASIAELANSAMDSFDARMKVYPALAREIQPLAKRGWFISMFFGLSEIDLMAHSAGTASPDELDLLVAKLYREGISHHVEDILREYPGRAFLLRPALEAHLRGEYAISIPIFFILADGICFEQAEKELFHGRDEEHILSRARAELDAAKERTDENPIADFFSLMSSAMWASISERLPLAYNKVARDRYKYEGLNRNTVLHGVADESYATEENSLKAFSLLSFLASLLAFGNAQP